MRLSKTLSAVHSYIQRIGRWNGIRRSIVGIEASDRRMLLKSWLWGFIDCWKSPLVWRDPLLLGDTNARVSGVGQFCLRARTDDLWHVYPAREPEVFAQIWKGLCPGDVFIDAGANIGFYSVLASRKVGPTGRVVAIEMMPGTAGILRKHLEINSCENAEVVERALSDVEGKFAHAYVTTEQCGQASLARSSGMSEKVPVKTTTLEEVGHQFGRVRLLKMDLEGLELRALRGAGNLIDRVDSICFEDRNGDSPARPFLEELGFELSQLGNADVLAVRRHQSNHE